MTAQAPGPGVDPGERGATWVADRVVAKIAAQAAREALRRAGERGEAERGAGAGGPVGDAHATVTVRRRVAPDTLGEARVRVAVELPYPCDIGARCGAVRRQVIERVSELAGMSVPEVVVQVERLHAAHTPHAPHAPRTPQTPRTKWSGQRSDLGRVRVR